MSERDRSQVEALKPGRAPSQRILDDILQRIVSAARPERVILFGSAARGEMGPNSDLDLLVVVPEPADLNHITTRVYEALRGCGAPVDAVIVSNIDVERYRHSHAMVIKPALREGRVLYADPTLRLPEDWRQIVAAREEARMAAGQYPPDDPREWLNRARSNLVGARTTAPGIYLQDLCYDAQQAAEKAIKAMYIFRGIEFPYVHDLEQLLLLLEAHGEQIPADARGAGQLTRFAFGDRYPGGGPAPTENEYRTYVAPAEAVVHWAEERIR